MLRPRRAERVRRGAASPRGAHRGGVENPLGVPRIILLSRTGFRGGEPSRSLVIFPVSGGPLPEGRCKEICLNIRLAPQFAHLLALVLAASLGCASDPKPGTSNTGGRGGRGGGATGGTGGPPPSFSPPAGRVEDGPFTCT